MYAFKKLACISALLAGALVGCGGGGSSTAGGSTLGGTAAVGSPIVTGTITISCAGGNPTTPATTTTDAVGAWSLTLTGQTLPCAVQVSGGTINGVTNTTPYHSIASAAGTVNVTPMTDLIVANATGSTAPSTWFAALTPTALAGITPAAMTASLTQIRTALNLPALNNVNPLTTAFTPAAGNPVDDILTALQLAITNTGSSLAALRTAAASPTFTPPVGFSTAINTQHGNTSSGGALAPAAPASITTSPFSASQINVSWASVPGATGYNLYRSTVANVVITSANKINSNPIATAGQVSAPYTNTGLAASTAYYYKVTALSPSGESAGSSETSSFTQAVASGGGSGSTANVPTGFVAQTNPSGALTMAPAAVVWTGSLFVALEVNQSFHSATAKLFSWTSADGISWTRNTTNLPNGVGALTAANGKAFMMGNGGSLFAANATVAMYSSTDGVTWTIGTAPIALGPNTGGTPIGVKYLNNKYMASLDTDSCNAIVSSDGVTWTNNALYNLALPSGYQKFVNNTYCGEPFYVGGKYIITGGLIYAQTGTGSSIATSYKGLVYSSADGRTWAVNTFDPPATINNIFQGGRTSYAVQVGSNIVMPLLQTNTTVSGTQVSSNKQYATSADGLAYTFGVHSGTPNIQMMGNLAANPSLVLPSGRVGFTVVSAQVNGVSTPTYSYAYTSDGYTFSATTDLMFINPLQVAYSPTLRRLVVIRQEASAGGYPNTGVTIGTLDLP